MEAINAMKPPQKRPKIARRKQGFASDSEDRFTSLPEPVIQFIFSFLETLDAIRASAVCRSWRYMWTSNPNVNFDIHIDWSSLSKYRHLSAKREKFNNFVSGVLMSESGPKSIEKFRLVCFFDYHLVCGWMKAAAERNVKEPDLIMDSYSTIVLPFILVTCETLMPLRLNLSERALKLPGFAGINSLKNLELERVELFDEVSTRDFITSCLLLEYLSMRECTFCELKNLEIAATNLKYLIIDNYFLYRKCYDDMYRCYDCLKKAELKVVCPSLEVFYYLGPSERDFSLQDLSSVEKALIRLNDFSMHAIDEESSYALCRMLRGLFNAKVLEPSEWFFELLNLAPTTSESFPTFCNLKSIKLDLGTEACDMKSMINLLWSSPSLEVITIHLKE